ncbi:hypothetical protein LTR67_006380 [Exophiala xenobiotica]
MSSELDELRQELEKVKRLREEDHRRRLSAEERAISELRRREEEQRLREEDQRRRISAEERAISEQRRREDEQQYYERRTGQNEPGPIPQCMPCAPLPGTHRPRRVTVNPWNSSKCRPKAPPRSHHSLGGLWGTPDPSVGCGDGVKISCQKDISHPYGDETGTAGDSIVSR